MLSPSSISDAVRDAQQARISHASNLVNWATAIVAVGVALEAVEFLHDGVVWIKRKRREQRERSELKELALIVPVGEIRGAVESHSDHPKWVKRTLRLGLILVVVGVVGEWRCGARLEDAHNAVHQYDIAKLTEADQKAGNAADSAKTAHDEVDAVGNKADTIDKRLDVASAQLGGLENKIAAQGPRGKLLVRAAPEIVKQVAPFAGQRVRLFVCGQLGVAHQETIDTWAAIANILGSSTVDGVAGAKWKILDPNLGWAANCGAAGGRGQGQGVAVSKRASQRTINAATALANALAKALPPSQNKMLGLIDPDFARAVVAQGLQPKDEPWNIVAFDEGLIAVTVGEHP
jgi:hypothetical protein